MRIAATSSLGLGMFCFVLPHTPPTRLAERVTARDVLGLDALQLLRDRSFAIFVIGSFLVSIPLQFYYAFANVTGQIYVDQKAPVHLRAVAQGLIAFVTLGVGMLIGSWLSGLVVDRYSVTAGAEVVHAWSRIWLVPAFGAGAVLALFAMFFTHEDDPGPANGTAPELAEAGG